MISDMVFDLSRLSAHKAHTVFNGVNLVLMP
jgi:hypothetical protein